MKFATSFGINFDATAVIGDRGCRSDRPTQCDPSKRAFAFAEEGPHVRRVQNREFRNASASTSQPVLGVAHEGCFHSRKRDGSAAPPSRCIELRPRATMPWPASARDVLRPHRPRAELVQHRLERSQISTGTYPTSGSWAARLLSEHEIRGHPLGRTQFAGSTCAACCQSDADRESPSSRRLLSARSIAERFDRRLDP